MKSSPDVGYVQLGILFTILAASAYGWRRYFRGSLRLDPATDEPCRDVPWDGAAVLRAALAYLLLKALGDWWIAGRFLRSLPAEVQAEVAAGNVRLVENFPDFFVQALQGSALVGLLTTLVVAAMLVAACRASLDDLGLALRRCGDDLRLAAAAFPMIVGPVLALNFALSAIVGESQHPILLAYKAAPRADLLWWSAVAAVGTAPLVEEFLFRGVLQGWLQRTLDPQPPAGPPPSAIEHVAPAGESAPSANRRRSLPIVLSSALFALAHVGHGPDPIPLFFFGLGLGYLYRRTHRIWPGVVVHLLLNALSLGLLFLAVERPAIE